jgi:hypothetical protein
MLSTQSALCCDVQVDRPIVCRSRNKSLSLTPPQSGAKATAGRHCRRHDLQQMMEEGLWSGVH